MTSWATVSVSRSTLLHALAGLIIIIIIIIKHNFMINVKCLKLFNIQTSRQSQLLFNRF
jgi:hypothetical protein